MSLWSNTDASGSVPKYFVSGDDGSSASMIFVSKEEAQLAENRERGLDSPGWYRYYTFTDQHGNTRHKAELQVATSNAYTTPATTADNNGDKFRAKLTTDTGAREVTSSVVTLTVT